MNTKSLASHTLFVTFDVLKRFIVKYIEVSKNLLYFHTNLFSDLYSCKGADG